MAATSGPMASPCSRAQPTLAPRKPQGAQAGPLIRACAYAIVSAQNAHPQVSVCFTLSSFKSQPVGVIPDEKCISRTHHIYL